MKRRLQTAYDHMTMPDDCARRIEQQLVIRQEEKRTGHHIRTVAPTGTSRRSWAAAAAAVCLMLVLSVGGTLLFLGTAQTAANVPTENITTVYQTVPGDYSVVTDIPAEDVETFALEVRKNVLEGDWEAFVQKVHYPIVIQDKTIGNAGGLTGLLIRNEVTEDFLQELRKESCNEMFCNWQGICMGGGQLWINEIGEELKITAINGMFGDLVDVLDFTYTKLPDGNYAVTEYAGRAGDITVANGFNDSDVTWIGSGEPVIRNGDAVRTVIIPETVTGIADHAFAGCEGLESIHFRGDAPPEAEGVFEGSENVTVYYLEGTSGWGDTWCGRKTEALFHLSFFDVSLGTVQIQDETPFLGILGDTEKFYSYDLDQEFFITEYCESQSAAMGITVTIPKFTLVDLAGADAKELILWVQAGEREPDHFLILRLENGKVNSYTLPYMESIGFKKDGAVYSAVKGTEVGSMRLEFLKKLGTDRYYVSEDFHTKPPVRWHAWPCICPEILLESYETASTEDWGSEMGNQFRLFEQLAKGDLENNWEIIKLFALNEGFYVSGESGRVSIFDPASPGTVLYGTLENNRFASIGYYISIESREYQAEIRGLGTDTPTYVADAHLPFLGSRGRMVSSLQELQDYLTCGLNGAVLITDRSREVPRILEVSKQYAEYYLAGNAAGMETLTSLTSSQKPKGYPGNGLEGKILYTSLTGTMVLEDSCSVSICLQEPGQTDSWSFLMLMLVREGEDWKVQSYALEK